MKWSELKKKQESSNLATTKKLKSGGFGLNIPALLKNAITTNFDIQSFYYITNLKFGKLDIWEEISKMKSSAINDIANAVGNLGGKKNDNIDFEIDKYYSLMQLQGFQNLSPLFIASVDIPTISANHIREWDGNAWAYSTSRVDIASFNIEFRDFSGGIFYKCCRDFFNSSLRKYPEDKYCTVSLARIVMNDAIRANNAPVIAQDDVDIKVVPLLFTNRAIMTHLSPPSFSQNTEIATFKATFDYDPSNPLA